MAKRAPADPKPASSQPEENFVELMLVAADFVRTCGGLVQAIHLKSLINVVVEKIRGNPYALLCGRPDCERCEAVRYG